MSKSKSSPILWVTALAVLAIGVAHAAEGEYDRKSKSLSPAPILVRGIRGDVHMTTKENGSPVRLENNSRIHQGSVVSTGNKSRVDLIFSNGAVIALDQNASLSIDQFLQAGGYDIAPPDEGGKGDVNATVPQIGTIDKEPSYSRTKLFLRQGTMYARVKKLHKRSTYEVGSALGKARILGTTWRQSIGEDRAKLIKKVEILLQEGLIEFDPIDSENQKNDPITIRPQEELQVSGTFSSLEAMNAALDVAVQLNVAVEMAFVQELIRDPEFAQLISNFLPTDRSEQIVSLGPQTGPGVDGGDIGFGAFGGDYGAGSIGGFGGSGGGSGRGNNNNNNNNNNNGGNVPPPSPPPPVS